MGCYFFLQCMKVKSESAVAQSCPTLCDPMNRSTTGLPVHHQLLSSPKPMSIESVMPSSHLILCRPLLLLPSIFPSIKVFSNESALRIRWPKYWSFSFNISPSNEHPVLVVSDSVRPHTRQPPGSPIPGILQARTLEWVAISFSNA